MPISVIIDYAHEPESMRQFLQTVASWREYGYYDYIIHLISADGGGRDAWKLPIVGDLSYKYANFSVVTTADYEKEDNPKDLLKALSTNYDPALEGQKYKYFIKRMPAIDFSIQKAKEIIAQGFDSHPTALQLSSVSGQVSDDKSSLVTSPRNSAQTKVLICSTAIGSQLSLSQPEGVIPWNERQIWKDKFSIKS